MVGGLFSRLLYAGSSTRTRTEDFLTELIVELLSRLTPAQQRFFCAEVLLCGQEEAKKRLWDQRVGGFSSLKWASQEFIHVEGHAHAKKPDIILYGAISNDERIPLLIVENKINAGFTTAVRFDTGDDSEPQSQLELYDAWLSVKSGGVAALVLLTHFIDPPESFLGEDGAYRVGLRAVCRWAEVYRWLADDYNMQGWQSDAVFLASELAKLIKELQIVTESASLQDFAAARLYSCGGAHKKFANTLDAARKAIQSRFTELDLKEFPNTPPRIYSEDSSGWICDSCRVVPDRYISWGYFFLREDEWRDAFDPTNNIFEGMYVCVDFGKGRITRPRGNEFRSWCFPTWEHGRSETFEVCKFAAFTDISGESTEWFVKWACNRFAEAVKLVMAVDKV